MPVVAEEEKARLIDLYEQLPPNSQHEVLDFAGYLAQREEGQVKYPQSTLDEVAGCLAYNGPAKTVQEMDDGIAKGVRRQWR